MFLKKEEIYYTSSDGQNKVYASFWIPDKPKMLLQIAHGMVEHIERYEDFAKFLNNYGIVVFGNDHLGHGNTAGNEEKFGYFSDEDGDKNIVDDMHLLTKMVKERYKDLPFAFLGHSMGSFLLRNYLFRYGQDIDAAIIMGTGSENPLAIKGGKAFIEKVARRKGWNYRSKVIDNLAFGGFNIKFGDKNGKEWLTRDEKEVAKYINDPKCRFVFTLNAYYNLLKILYSLTQDKNLENMPKDLHILFVSGDKDPVGDFGHKVLNVYEKFKALDMKNVDCKLYKGYRHEILNEMDKEIVYNDILKWLEEIYEIKTCDL
ncbi:alpha/beta fold hydrolase [uncultured Tyzzerella sp.]|uniref:alpha/beta fold hydrolase n=1 Tax=uncultured Tyzzerella sp. TaxID=2321398 RepID=UPI00294376A9|nr:alpha/beta fold hydrolase [uncultured Tyzzerella sp.]